jgi:hypothetical protein
MQKKIVIDLYEEKGRWHFNVIACGQQVDNTIYRSFGTHTMNACVMEAGCWVEDSVKYITEELNKLP